MAVTSSTDDATVTAVAASVTAVTLFVGTGQVAYRSVYNDSTSTLYLKYGSSSSTALYTAQVQPQGFYDIPGSIYTGLVTGIWLAANGSAMCTEVS